MSASCVPFTEGASSKAGGRNPSPAHADISFSSVPCGETQLKDSAAYSFQIARHFSGSHTILHVKCFTQSLSMAPNLIGLTSEGTFWPGVLEAQSWFLDYWSNTFILNSVGSKH